MKTTFALDERDKLDKGYVVIQRYLIPNLEMVIHEIFASQKYSNAKCLGAPFFTGSTWNQALTR